MSVLSYKLSMIHWCVMPSRKAQEIKQDGIHKKRKQKEENSSLVTSYPTALKYREILQFLRKNSVLSKP